MTTIPKWRLHKEYYPFSGPHDLDIDGFEYVPFTTTESGVEITRATPSTLHRFRAKREVVAASSTVWRDMLEGGFEEQEVTVLELHQDPPLALQTWLQLLHSTSPTLADAALPSYDEVGIKDVWEMLSTAHKYGLDTTESKAKAWFEGWWQAKQHAPQGGRFGHVECQALILPCRAFDYAPGFALVTKELVYRSVGLITERQPDGFTHDDLHVSREVMLQLNGAKNRLKLILHRELHNPIEAVLNRADCECRPNVLLAYEVALAQTGVWPLERTSERSSANDLLGRLDKFRADQPQTCGGRWCSFDFAKTVKAGQETVRTYFDGLCLDCMSHSKLGDDDKAYWQHTKLDGTWDQGCRVRHKQSSWYFSFMGSKQKMVRWTKSPKKRGDGGGGSSACGMKRTDEVPKVQD